VDDVLREEEVMDGDESDGWDEQVATKSAHKERRGVVRGEVGDGVSAESIF
jgi:hypothetical protein